MRQLISEVMLVLVLVSVGYVLWEKYTTSKPPASGESVIATVAPAVKGAPTKDVVIKKPVRTFQGKSKERLKLPDAVQKDENQQVVAASQVKADLHPQTVSTVVNTETGKVETFVKIDPYPWLAIENRGEIKMAYGMKYQSFDHATHQVGRLQFGYDAVHVKALTVGITGTLDTDRDAFLGVGVSYRW